MIERMLAILMLIGYTDEQIEAVAVEKNISHDDAIVWLVSELRFE